MENTAQIPSLIAPKDSGAIFQALFAASIDAVLVTAPDGRILAANTAAGQLFGRTAEELVQVGRAGIWDASDARWTSALDERTRTGSFRGELRFLRSNGEPFTGEISTAIFHDANSEVRSSVVIRDITERKRSEEARRASEERFEHFFNCAPVPLWEEDFSAVKDRLVWLGATTPAAVRALVQEQPEELRRLAELVRIIDCNAQAGSFHGTTTRKEIGRTIVQGFDEYSFEKFGDELIALVAGETRFVCEIPVCTLRGQRRDLLLSLHVAPGAEHTWSRIFVSAIDLTERNQQDKVNRRNEKLLREAQETARIGSYITDLATGRWESSEVLNELFGIPSDHERTIDTWGKLIHPEDRAKAVEHFHHATAHHEPFRLDYRIIRPSDGALRWMAASGRLEYDNTGKAVRLLGSIQDITERELAAETLRRSEEKFIKAFSRAPNLMSISRVDDGTYLDVNDRFLEVSGFTREEVIGHRSTELGWVSAADRARLVEVLRAKGAVHDLELALVGKGGRRVDVLFGGEFIMVGEQRCLLSNAVDITARRVAETLLRMRSAALEVAANSIMITDRSGTIEWVNRAFTTLSGWSSVEAIGRTPRDLLNSGLHDAAFFRQMWTTILAGRVWHGEIVNRRKDGTTCTEDLTITPLADETGTITHFIAIKQDITGRKLMEVQSRHAQRMEAIGTLAGGIAHDLNNILSPILMVSSVLKDNASDDRDREMFEMLQNGARRGANIISQLLTFSRGIEGDRITVQPRHIIKEIMAIMRETFPRQIELASEAPSDLPVLTADPTQLHQVLLNLCVNARDAMPEGGRLSLRARTADFPAGDPVLPPEVSPGLFVLIEVRDTGHGVPPEIMSRIFDPFFTTKPAGKGTGLGLSTTLGIVRSHGGFLTLESELGLGTVFTVYLPVGRSADSDRTADQRDTESSGGQGELILVVDDESDVRQAHRFALETNGYRVIEAVNGQHAIGKFKSQRREIALILTDLMMPVLGGLPLIKAVRATDTHVPIVAMTGLGENKQLEELRKFGVLSVLSKPLEANALLKEVKARLGSGDNAFGREGDGGGQT